MDNNGLTLSNEPRSFFKKRGVMLLCFLVPFLSMILIYSCITVWPVGEKSVLVLDLNAQYVFYFEKFRDILLSGDSILYSFQRALGGEFMGIFAYYLSSPLSVIVALFPKVMITEAIYFLLVLKCGLCGLSFGYFLTKTRKLTTSQTVMLSSMYALSSFAVVMQHNLMWTDNIIAFPLVLLAVDELIKHGKFKLYVAAVVYSVFSNFYVGYMTCLFILIWFFVRYLMLAPEERNPMGEKQHFLKTLARIVLYSLTAILICAIIILPIYYSLSFGKLEFSNPDFSPKSLYNFADILTKAFIGSYDTLRPDGMPFIYCSTLAMILLPLFFFLKSIPTRKKIGFAVILAIFAVSLNFGTADLLWHGLQRPNWLNARFAYMFVGIELVMAAITLERIWEIGERPIFASAIFGCTLLIILDKIGYDNVYEFTTVWLGILFFAVTAVALGVYIKSLDNVERKKKTAFIMCVLVVTELLVNGVIMMCRLDEDVVISKRTSYRDVVDKYREAVGVIEDNDNTFFRAEKLVHRNKNDNFALGLNGLSNSTSTLNAKTIKLLSKFGYASRAHWSMYAGATAVSDALMGIKYVITDESGKAHIMSYIYDTYEKTATTDGGLDIYENPYALSIAYAADSDILTYDKPNADNAEVDYTDPFTYMNEALSALVGHKVTVWHEVSTSEDKQYSCDVVYTTGHKGYKPTSDGGKVSYELSIDSYLPVYFYFPSDYPRDAEVKADGTKVCNYFDGETFSIRELGSYTPGEDVTVDLVPKESVMYVKRDCSYFWYFDSDAFEEAVVELKDGCMTAYSERDDYVHGTVNVPEGLDLMFTTIPYDESWVVTVDGEVVEKLPILGDALIAFKVNPGSHEIEFRYKPDCVKYGLIISAAGIVIFAALCVLERYRKKKEPLTCVIPGNAGAYDGEAVQETSDDGETGSEVEQEIHDKESSGGETVQETYESENTDDGINGNDENKNDGVKADD